MDSATKESFGWNLFAGPVLDYCLASTTKSSHKDWPYKSEEGKWLKVLRSGLPQNQIVIGLVPLRSRGGLGMPARRLGTN